MKLFRKIAVFALTLAMLFSVAACGGKSNDGDNNTGGDDSQTTAGYTDPNTVFTKYDNKSYNEYLLGDDAVIDNQWSGYGIGDPFVMRYDGKYYLYCSTLDTEIGVRAYVSADLVNWTPLTGEGLKTGYVSEDTVTLAAYAPEVYYYDGTFYMYTSPGGGGHYVLTANSPAGPFVKATNNFGLSIDGSVLIDDDESMWFTYADGSGIKMAKMNNMLSVNTSATLTLGDTSIGGWTEGPYILKRGGTYYLTYTGNNVGSDGYRIAYATSDHVANRAAGIDRNAFTRAANNPIALATETDLKGIGHSSTVMGPDMDSHYIVYHYLNSSGGPNRSLGIDRLTFNGTMMSTATMLEGSIKPALPAFYAQGLDSEKFDAGEGITLSKDSTAADFTAEFNVSGTGKATVIVGYADADNYGSVEVDLAAKKVKLNLTEGGETSTVATGTLYGAFTPSALHTVRVAVRDGKADVSFDNMTKISGKEINLKAGKIGYGDIGEGTVSYTAFSNSAGGMSDEREAKQAYGYVGANTYLRENTYNRAYNLSDESGIEVLEDYPFEGVKSMKLAKEGDYASYLVNFPESARLGLELIYPADDGGERIAVKVGGGKVYRMTLPEITTDDDYVQAIVGEFDVTAGITTVRMEGLDDEISYVAFRFTTASGVTPSYEATLENYADRGVDYKTIWKLKDGGHYAKAGTRQLVYFGDNTITDFTLEVDIKLEGNTGTSTAGLVFHASNYAASSHDSYTSIQGYYLSFNNNYTVLERLNYADDVNQLTTVAGADNPFKTSDQFITVKVQVRGNRITVWAGETKLIDIYDSFAFTSGKIGLYTNGAAAIFRNLKISA